MLWRKYFKWSNYFKENKMSREEVMATPNPISQQGFSLWYGSISEVIGSLFEYGESQHNISLNLLSIRNTGRWRQYWIKDSPIRTIMCQIYRERLNKFSPWVLLHQPLRQVTKIFDYPRKKQKLNETVYQNPGSVLGIDKNESETGNNWDVDIQRMSKG